MTYENTLEFAQRLDAEDPLKSYREKFHFPQHDGKNVLYFCGNSLGLQPKSVRPALEAELDQWAEYGVEGHFKGELPWMYYHKFLKEQAASVVGAKPLEVVVMNTLTVNLHLMMVSFYRPKGSRTKIIMEAGAFPSDQYAMETQARHHGLDPSETIIELTPREGEHTLRTEDILDTIAKTGDELALVMLGGVNYYTGQYFNIPAITEAAHKVGAIAGFDLAHAAGNLPLHLHDWGVDFAVWCSYKYMNAGPGGPSGTFVHERHASKPEMNRFAGWWGHHEGERFQMKKGFIPMEGADGWQLSNAQIFSFAAYKASLDMFLDVGMEALRTKSLKMTAFMEFVLRQADPDGSRFQIITPTDPEQRGAQLSILTDDTGKALHDQLTAKGVISDWREPNVIRLAPVPMYNSFVDVYELGQMLGG